MGQKLAAKIYWDSETGFISLVTEPDVDGLNKINLMFDLQPEIMKWMCHTNNEQRLVDMFPVLHYDAEEARMIGEQLRHLDNYSACDTGCETEGEGV